MDLGLFKIYIVIINIIGFVLFIINDLLYSHNIAGRIDKLLVVNSLVGGSLGILISMIFFDNKPKKENIMLKIFVICIFIIELVIFLFIKMGPESKITFAFWKLFYDYKFLSIYIIIINLISLILFAIDKVFAILNKNRIRIITLIGICFMGGSIGGLLAMYLFRHKTKQESFTIGIPLILIMHIVILLYLSNLI